MTTEHAPALTIMYRQVCAHQGAPLRQATAGEGDRRCSFSSFRLSGILWFLKMVYNQGERVLFKKSIITVITKVRMTYNL